MYIDYIKNQLLLINTANEKTILSQESKDAVKGRIALLIYGAAYNATTKAEMKCLNECLHNIDGLDKYINSVTFSGEKKWIIRWIMKGQYQKTYAYFFFRNRIRNIVRRMR